MLRNGIKFIMLLEAVLISELYLRGGHKVGVCLLLSSKCFAFSGQIGSLFWISARCPELVCIGLSGKN